MRQGRVGDEVRKGMRVPAMWCLSSRWRAQESTMREMGTAQPLRPVCSMVWQ